MKLSKHFFKTLLTLLVLISRSLVFAQTDQGGFIVPNDSAKQLMPYERMVYLPQQGFTLYQAPHEGYAGRITPGPPQNPAGTPAPVPEHMKNMQASISAATQRPQTLDLSFFFETFDDCYYIPFDQNEKGFIRVGSNTGWISIKEIEKSGFKITSWMDFYGSPGMQIVPIPNSKISLRSSPYADAEILTEVNENEFEIEVITFDEGKSREGSYCYVKATHFKVHPCYGGEYDASNIIKVYSGWIRLINDKGERLIRHNSHGC